MLIVYFGAISEQIAVLICPFGLLVIKTDRVYTERSERVQLARLRNSVMIHILPQSQRSEHCVMGVDHPISVAAVFGFVVLGQRCKPVEALRRRLRCKVAEQLGAVIDTTVAVSIKREESIVRTSSGPGSPLPNPIAVKIEVDAARGICELKPVTCDVD